MLILPLPIDVRAVDPSEAISLEKRRVTLFETLMQLSRLHSELDAAQFCRYKVLEALFGAGSIAIGEAWERVLVIRGAELLDAFQQTIAELLETRCIVTTTPSD